MSLKNFLKIILGKKLISVYHFYLARLAAFVYGSPSEKLIVIGVTGTNGKSTTANLIGKILEEAGSKVAVTSTVNFKIAKHDQLNDQKMTMPGRFFLQKFLKGGVKQGCRYAVIETSSEGVVQHRHIGIHYDVLVFTNLTPEHLEAHGGFENYKNAKLNLFRYLEKLPHKIMSGKKIQKIIASNADDPYVKEFTNFKVDRIVSFGQSQADVQGSDLKISPQGISFKVEDKQFNLKLKGQFDFYNALAAIAVASALGIGLETAKQALENTSGIPGRMEIIEGPGFKVLVDYAPEPEGLRQMYATIKNWPAFAHASAGKPHNKIIHVLGSTGGGRDVSRRKILGEIAGQSADIVIVTNEDPYDDDPQSIIDDVASGSPKALKILDRREAIAKALNLAGLNDLVVVTGKGAEQKMAVKGGYIDWDDRKVVNEELEKLQK